MTQEIIKWDLSDYYTDINDPLIEQDIQNLDKSAENFYANLAKIFKDPQEKILTYLSKVEHSHYMMLQSEYALAQDFEDYAEEDIDKVIT